MLVGGALAGRTSRHNLVTAVGLSVTGATTVLIGFADPGAVLMVLVVSLGGLASGVGIPSRDMIVRSATPPGSFGKVFGFVTTGLHIGGMIAPVVGSGVMPISLRNRRAKCRGLSSIRFASRVTL